MTVSRRRREPTYLIGAAFIGWMLFVLWTDSQILLRITVAGIGLMCFGLAAHGKPERPGVGITARLLHLLPEPAWRIAMTCMGLVILGAALFLA